MKSVLKIEAAILILLCLLSSCAQPGAGESESGVGLYPKQTDIPSSLIDPAGEELNTILAVRSYTEGDKIRQYLTFEGIGYACAETENSAKSFNTADNPEYFDFANGSFIGDWVYDGDGFRWNNIANREVRKFAVGDRYGEFMTVTDARTVFELGKDGYRICDTSVTLVGNADFRGIAWQMPIGRYSEREMGALMFSVLDMDYGAGAPPLYAYGDTTFYTKWQDGYGTATAGAKLVLTGEYGSAFNYPEYVFADGPAEITYRLNKVTLNYGYENSTSEAEPLFYIPPPETPPQEPSEPPPEPSGMPEFVTITDPLGDSFTIAYADCELYGDMDKMKFDDVGYLQFNGSEISEIIKVHTGDRFGDMTVTEARTVYTPTSDGDNSRLGLYITHVTLGGKVTFRGTFSKHTGGQEAGLDFSADSIISGLDALPLRNEIHLTVDSGSAEARYYDMVEVGESAEFDITFSELDIYWDTRWDTCWGTIDGAVS